MWCNSSVWLPSTAGACLQPHGCSSGDRQVIPSPGTTSEPAALGGKGLSSRKLLCPCPHPCPPPCKLSSDPSRSGWDAHVCSMGTCLAELSVWTNACCDCSGTWERSPSTSSVSHSHGMLSALCPLPVRVAAGPPHPRRLVLPLLSCFSAFPEGLGTGHISSAMPQLVGRI